SSPDGIIWTEQVSGGGFDLTSLADANGMFISFEGLENGFYWTSTDGTAWTRKNTGIPATIFGIAYGHGTVVAVGESGTILTSPDGSSWTRQRQSHGTQNPLTCVTHGSGNFVAVTSFGAAVTSSNGILWSEEVTMPTLYFTWLHAVT